MINIHTHKYHHDVETEVFNMIIGKDSLPAGIFSCGIHPWYIDQLKEQLSNLSATLKNKNCIGLGECGLDSIKGADSNLQIEAFESQIILAKELNKPLIIHCVKKYEAVANALVSNNYKDYFLLHGFNAKPYTAHHYNKLPNAVFSFGAALLKPESKAEQLFLKLPLEKCFFETDDSDERIENIYLRAAELKGLSIEEVIKQVSINFNRVFINGRN